MRAEEWGDRLDESGLLKVATTCVSAESEGVEGSEGGRGRRAMAWLGFDGAGSDEIYWGSVRGGPPVRMLGSAGGRWAGDSWRSLGRESLSRGP